MKNKLKSRKQLFFVVGLVLVVLAIMTGCAAPAAEEPAPTNTITGIVWQWVTLTEKSTGNTTAIPNPESYVITFNTDGTFSGTADCNNFSGTYSQENGFVITLGATTMAFCGEASLDQQYLDLLSGIVAGGPDGQGGLALETAGGEQRMMFKNGGPAAG
jgi:heat shock protein HslJ